MALVDQFFSAQLNQYLEQHTDKEASLLTELREYTEANTDFAKMLSGPVEGALLRMLIKLLNPKNCLEIGMFTGYSALQIASALSDNATLTCLETRRKYADIAQSFFNKSEHGNKIKIVLGDAHKTITELNGPFDLVFCDADKSYYSQYYEEVMPKLNTGGLFIADNALWGGTVLTPNDKDSIALDKFNKMVRDDTRVENVLLSVRDGLMITRKK